MADTSLYLTPNVLRESSTGIQAIPIRDELYARREVECVGEIDERTTYSICQQLRQLAHEDPSEVITLFINSPGGEITSGLAIYDVMQAIPCPVHTVCLGMAASMAALLLAAGDWRQLLPHARVMLHDPRTTHLEGDALAVSAASHQLMRTRDEIARIIAEHAHHDAREVLETTRTDTWFDADHAVAWGLADEVITKLPITRKEARR